MNNTLDKKQKITLRNHSISMNFQILLRKYYNQKEQNMDSINIL